MSSLGKILNIFLFALVSVVFLPMVGIVNLVYASWEKWFEQIAKS